tara:strand:+ start:94 stop:273 length:180 start_codon:yes stop_codon:yes gene_type:complete
MQPSTTSSWGSAELQKLSCSRGLNRDALITSTTRELVEFYWTNRKRFSGGYTGFPTEVS